MDIGMMAVLALLAGFMAGLMKWAAKTIEEGSERG